MDNNNNTTTSILATTTTTTQPLLKHSTPAIIIYTTAYTIVFILAIINNSVVLIVIKKFPPMKSVTNCFLANLASADLFVSFLVLPFNLLENLFTEWRLGWFLCKTIPFLQAVAILASVNTLTAVAIERFCVIMYPMRVIISSRRASIIIIFIWLLPACIQIPWIVLYGTIDSAGTFCSLDTKSPIFQVFIMTVFIVFYIIPLCIMSLLYILIGVKVCSREVSNTRGSQAERKIRASKTRVVRMLVTVTVIFALSWLPLYILKFRILFGPSLKRAERGVYFDYLIPVAQWMGSANSCINPLIYCYFSSSFRESTKTVLKYFFGIVASCCCCCCCCKTRKNNSNESENTNRPKSTTMLVNADKNTDLKMVVVANA